MNYLLAILREYYFLKQNREEKLTIAELIVCSEKFMTPGWTTSDCLTSESNQNGQLGIFSFGPFDLNYMSVIWDL